MKRVFLYQFKCLSLWLCFILNGAYIASAQQSTLEADALISIADQLLEANEYKAAFDTLLYGMRQVEPDPGQKEPDQTRQNKAYLQLLDVLTQRANILDQFGQFLPLEDRIPYLEEAIAISEEQGMDSLLAAKTFILGITHNLLTNYQESITHQEKVKAIAESNGLDELFLRSLFQLSKDYRSTGQVEKSLSTLINYEKRSEELGITYHMQTSMEALGNFYLNQKDYVRSVAYYKKGVQLAEEYDLDPYYSLTSLAISFDDSDSLEQAQATYQKAFDHLKTIEKDQDYYYKMSGLAINYATFFNSKKKDYGSALAMFQEGLGAAEAIDFKYYIAYAKEGIAESYHEMREDELALKVRIENYDLVYYIGDVELTRQAELGISQSYERLGRYKKALEHFQHSKLLSDSLLNLGKVQAISALETEFETEKKEQEIALLNEKTQRQKARQNGFIIIGALLLIVLVVAFLALRSKQRANRLITSQKDALARSNQQLTELSEFKESLTHMIVHDMKNPLNAVIGLSKGEVTQKKLHTIGQSGQQMLNMVSNMLDVQKFEEAKFTLHRMTHRLDNLLTEAVLPLELLMHARNLTLKKSFNCSLYVEVDRELVVRVLGNLLSNAIKFSELGSEIEVTQGIEAKDGFITVDVIDHGQGIPEDQLKQVFDKYWQGAKQSGYSSSTGLGLTFCKLAVDAHGGEISVDSKPGKFTHFSFSLPLAKAEDIRKAEMSEPPEREESLILESDITVLTKFIDQLDQLKVHEVGKINDIIREIDKEDIKSPWKFHLISAIHQGNQNRFDQLVEMLK